MYEIIKNVIEAGNYELGDMLKKINTVWIESNITDEQKKEMSEDEIKKPSEGIQKQTDKRIKEIDQSVEVKSKEILTV